VTNRDPGDWFKAVVLAQRRDNKLLAMADRARARVAKKKRDRLLHDKYYKMDSRRWIRQGSTKRRPKESWRSYGKHLATNVAAPAVANYLLRAAFPGSAADYALTVSNAVLPYSTAMASRALSSVGQRAMTSLPGAMYHLTHRVVSNYH
jgi:hypothetical protein